MDCPRCGHGNAAEARFCADCGARLEPACPKCGTELRPGARFCHECGEPVAGGQPARFTAPESYTPRHLAEKIITSKAGLEGERKQVTVLFADLKGSTELLADRDPEEARKLLDPVLERMLEAVHRYEGTVNHVMGDGIMALFGAPLAHEDHAVRACYAALRMQETVKAYALEARRLYGVEVQIRVGLNSGDVLVRSIGSDLAMDYTAVGQTSQLAARMEQLATPGTIRLSADTLTLAEGHIGVKPVGAIPVKGLDDPVEMYELLGASAVRSRLRAAVARGLTTFVGRTTEMEQLRAALDRARAGRGQVVAVVGEAGVGKSRLYYEFVRSPNLRDCLVVESAMVSYGGPSAYLPIIDLLQRYFRVASQDDVTTVRTKVSDRLLALDPALEPFLTPFLWLLGASTAEPGWERLDPEQRQRRILDGVCALLVRESQVQPVVAVFEDLHWMDPETRALLDALVHAIETTRVLILVNYRPPAAHPWVGKTYYQEIRVDALSAASAVEFLDALLGHDASVQQLKPLLITHTGGTPFFLEESVRMLVETRASIGERGAYSLVKPVEAIQVPATVTAVLAARVDQVSPEDKALLQAASVVGKDVPFHLLVAIADTAEEEVRQGLARLQAAGFLYEAQLFPDLEYSFTHALTHDVVYSSLLRGRRRALHLGILEAMERRHGSGRAEHAERLADHALQGEAWDRAVTYLQQAGAKAWSRGALPTAAERYERALECLRRLPSTPETTRHAIDICLALSPALALLGSTARCIEHMGEAARLAGDLGDQLLMGRIFMRITSPLWIEGRYPESIDHARRALEIAAAIDDRALGVGATYALAASYGALGRYPEAIEALTSIIDGPDAEIARSAMGVNLSVNPSACAWLATFFGLVGDFTRARSYGERGMEPARSDPLAEAMLACCRTIPPLVQGEFRQAEELAEHAVRLCETNSAGVWMPTAYALRGSARAWLGRFADALPDLERGPRLYERAGGRGYLGFLYLLWAEGLLLANRREAREIAERALEIAVANGERGNEAPALRLLGEIHAVHNVEAAEARYEQALSLAIELGLRPLAARCHLGLGQLYRSCGKREPARTHLRTAWTLFRELDMPFWLARTETELTQAA